MLRRWLIALVAVLALSTDAWAGAPRRVLWCIDGSTAEEWTIGVMVSEDICVLIAQVLRDKRTGGFSYVCRPAAVRT